MRRWTGHYLLRYMIWFVACSTPTRYLKQCWLVLISPLIRSFSGTYDAVIFMYGNLFENVYMYKMSAILFRFKCINVCGVQLLISDGKQAEPWWRASIWRSHRKVVMKQCSYHNNIIDIKNRLPYSKVVYPAIIVLFSCLMEVNHGVRTGPDYPFR